MVINTQGEIDSKDECEYEGDEVPNFEGVCEGSVRLRETY